MPPRQKKKSDEINTILYGAIAFGSFLLFLEVRKGRHVDEIRRDVQNKASNFIVEINKNMSRTG